MIESQKKIVESTIYNLIETYLGLILGIISIYCTARLLTPEEWGALLISLVFINFILFLCYLFPPAAQASLAYYISSTLGEEKIEWEKIRASIIYTYKIRIISSLFFFIIIFFLFSYILNDSFLSPILLILSPTIILNTIMTLNQSIFLSYKKFNMKFIINIIRGSLYTFIILIIFLFQLQNPLILITYAHTFSILISFFPSIIFLRLLIPKKNQEIKKVNLSKFKSLHKEYGLNLIFIGLCTQLNLFIINILYVFFDLIEYSTYMTICQSLVSIIINLVGSDQKNYLTIFTSINLYKNPENFKKLFYQLSRFLFLFLYILIGVSFFFIDLYIEILYSEKYFFIIFYCQLFILVSFPRVLLRVLFIIPLSTNKTILYLKLNVFDAIFGIFLVFIALSFRNFSLLIFFALIQLFLLPIILISLINYSYKIKLNYFRLFKPFLMFLLNLIIIIPFTFILNLQLINIPLIDSIINRIILIITFFIIFFVLIHSFKIITRQEVIYLLDIIPIINQKGLLRRIVEKFIIFLPMQKDIKKNIR
ncbi:MAG: lipopolysaccharide biosynthesis protein [Promethearchaeia archaeon]